MATNKLSSIAHKIKHRQTPKDVFITPVPLAVKCIAYHNPFTPGTWLDPFMNDGSFYKNFPTNPGEKDWCEILNGKDFFQYKKKVSIISSNPPYSLLDKVFEHTLKICEVEFGYLIGMNNLTARRIEMCNKAGFYLKSMFMCKVYKWWGMSIYVVFSKKIDKNIIDYDRVVWK